MTILLTIFPILYIIFPSSPFLFLHVKPWRVLTEYQHSALKWLVICFFPCCCCCCQVASVVSDSMRPHRRQPTRLPHPWDSLGKNTGMGCHFLLQCMKVKSESEVAQSCLTLSDPTNCSLPGSSIHGIFQARVLEWGAIAFSFWALRWLHLTLGLSFLHILKMNCVLLHAPRRHSSVCRSRMGELVDPEILSSNDTV